MRLLSIFAVVSAALGVWNLSESPARSDSGLWAERHRAAETLREALRACSAGEVDVDRQRIILTEAVAAATELLGTESLAAQGLTSTAEAARAAFPRDPRRAVETLKAAIQRAEREWAFALRVEAEQPQGFPRPTPPGEIEVKPYPAYRMARAEPSAGRAFWTLFMHIKRNGVAMTAPVEMNLDGGPADAAREESMAFLYEEPNQGRAGRDGAVEVIDVDPMTVVSTGVRGPRTESAVGEARRRLESWLERQSDRWAPAGPVRVMAYNSPFVPRDQNFFEVQIPLRPIGVEPGAPGPSAPAALPKADLPTGER